MTDKQPFDCPDCTDDLTRRHFVKAVGAVAAVGVTPLMSNSLYAAPTAKSKAENAAQKLHSTLNDKQKSTMCFPFNHKLQQKLSANWSITKPGIGSDFYTKEQQSLIEDVVKEVTSEEGFATFQKQMQDDWGGFGKYTIALFGEPGSGKFQFELTGRHLTLRADGDSVDNMAFGGPIVYGHGASNPKKNLFHYQTQKTNAVFKALDAKQRKQALVAKAPKESNVPLQGKNGTFPGIGVGSLTSDQKKLVEAALQSILSPYRKEDVDEVMAILKQGGGTDKLHMAFYQQGDLQNDKVWDIWRVEGPTFVWHFRGAPHVHAYINIGVKKS